jgi:hypothetical protein
MYLGLNRRFAKNMLVLSCILAVIYFFTMLFQTIPANYVLFIAFAGITWELFASCKTSEDTQLQLIQSYLDKKFIFKVLGSVHLDKESKDESLQAITENILDYFLFHAVNIYQIKEQKIQPLCASGNPSYQELKILSDFLNDHNGKNLPEISLFSDEQQECKLFIIPLMPNNIRGALTFRTCKNHEMTEQDLELLKKTSIIVNKLLD